MKTKKLSLALLAVLSLSSLAFSQGGLYQDRAEGRVQFSPYGNALVALPGATVTVCTDSTCATPVTLYSDVALTLPFSSPANVAFADLNGNFSFYVAPGIYWCTVRANGFAALSRACQVSTTTAVNGVFTSILTGSINKTLYVDGRTYACSDVGFNAAIGALPATGGTIDARGCVGAITIASTVRINKPGTTLILSGAATYTNTSGVPVNQGMFSPEADNVTILGNNAKLVVVGTVRAAIRSLNSCANVTVRDLVITGDATIGEQQEGIEFSDSSQGWTFKHIQLIHNTISDVNIGIDLINTDPVSTTEDVLAEGNKIFNMVGVLAGSGYGLISNNFNSNTGILRPMALKIIGNHFENSGRHEVYTSMTSGVTVTGNTFLRHRSSVFTNADLAAVPIARVTNYVLADNVFDTCYDGCVDVQTDSAVPPSSLIARNISITGNVFRNSQWYDIIIGTAANPATDGFPDGVTIAGNAFYKDSSQIPTLAFFIFIQSGKNISINSNSFYMKGVAGDLIDIEGSFDAAGTALATDRIFVQGNLLFGDTAGVTPFRFNSAASTSAIRADFINNYVSIPSGNVFGFISAQTDPNIHVFNTLTSGLDLTKVAPLDGFSGRIVQSTASGAATVDLASVASGACTADSTDVTLTGAAVGDPVRVTAGTALPAGVWLVGRVTATNTGRFQLCNASGGAVDRASDTYTISVVK